MQTAGRLALGWLVDAGTMNGKAGLARHRVRHVAVERPLALLVAPVERVQMRLRLYIYTQLIINYTMYILGKAWRV